MKLPFAQSLPIQATAILAAWLAIALWTASALAQGNTAVHAENGPLENAQVLAIGLAGILFLGLACFEKKSNSLFDFFLALLCYSFALRELDVETFDLPSFIHLIGSGSGRNATTGLAYLALLAYAIATGISLHWRAGISFLKTTAGKLLAAAAAILIAGDLFEKAHSVPHHEYLEEATELLGYCLVLAAGLAKRIAYSQQKASAASQDISPQTTRP